MKTSISRFLAVITFMALMFFGCSKTTDLNNGANLPLDLPSSGLHVYGLLPMTPDQYLNVPLYSKELFESKLKTKATTIPVPVYTLDTPGVRDQGQIGSCTAFCGVEANEILYYYKNNKNWTSLLSPAFIYYCERVLILKQKITADQGAYMVNIPQALQKYGDCLETSYAYPSSNRSTAYKTAPKPAAMTEGLLYRIGQLKTSYAAINLGDSAAVKNILRSDVPVMMGFNVYDVSAYTIFEGLNTTNYTYNPLTASGALVAGAKLLGGHAVPIVGYDDTKKVFLCQNSWGTGWGNHGFFYLPYSVFMSKTVVPTGNLYYATLN